MADDCDITACCAQIQATITAAALDMETMQATAWTSLNLITTEAAAILDIVNRYTGGWVPTIAGDVPSLAEIVQRITSFGVAWGEWSFFEYTTGAARSTFTLPIAPTGPMRVTVNAVQLPPTDYTLIAATLTLDDPIELNDILTIKSYGATP